MRSSLRTLRMAPLEVCSVKTISICLLKYRSRSCGTRNLQEGQEKMKCGSKFKMVSYRLDPACITKNLRCAQQRRDGAPLDGLVVELRARNHVALCVLMRYGLEYVDKISVGNGIWSGQDKPAATVGINAYNMDSSAPGMHRSPPAPYPTPSRSRERTGESRRRLGVCTVVAKAGIH